MHGPDSSAEDREALVELVVGDRERRDQPQHVLVGPAGQHDHAGVEAAAHTRSVTALSASSRPIIRPMPRMSRTFPRTPTSQRR